MKNDNKKVSTPTYRVGNPKFQEADTKYSKNMHCRAWVGLIVLILLEGALFTGCLVFSVVDKSLLTDYYIEIIGSAGGIGILIAVVLATYLW